MSKKFSSILIWVVVLVVLFFSVKKQIILWKNGKLIDSNPSIEIGTIINYYQAGVGTYHLEYKYSVENEEFRNNVVPKRQFKSCQNDEYCIGKNLYIRYYIDDPSISEPIFDSLPNNWHLRFKSGL